MSPYYVLLSMVIGFVVTLIMAVILAARPLPSIIEGGYSARDIRSGRLAVLLGLAAVVGASAFGSSTGIFLSLVDDTTSPIPRIIRFLLTFTLCWYTFHGRVWAYWLTVISMGLGIVALMPALSNMASEGIPALLTLFPFLFLLTHWSLGIIAITGVENGRRFIRCQRDAHQRSQTSSDDPISPIPASEALGELVRSRAARIVFMAPITLIVGFTVFGMIPWNSSPRNEIRQFGEGVYAGLAGVGVDPEEFFNVWADSSFVATQLHSARASALYLSDEELVELLSSRKELIEISLESGLYELCDASNIAADMVNEALSVIVANVNEQIAVLLGKARGRDYLGVQPQAIYEPDSDSALEFLYLLEASVEGDDQATELLSKFLDAQEGISDREKCEWGVMSHTVYLENAYESLGTVTVLDFYRWDQLTAIAEMGYF